MSKKTNALFRSLPKLTLKLLYEEGSNRTGVRERSCKGKVFPFEWGRMLVLAPTAEKHNKISEDIGNELNNTVG